jgi:hypothetical protein
VEEGLSAPISFEGLKQQSLPLERPDTITEDIDVVRVPLATAVQFIIGLEVREDLASPNTKREVPLEVGLCPSLDCTEDKQARESPETWADAHMIAAEKHGYDNDLFTWEFIRRVQADLVGEDFIPFEPMLFGNLWK